ncbi:MAG: cytochrome c biogenesis heme-transporting ATPase CcmA [Marinobacterium sp.]|nr:cytochrome c biogenesis heme-transporting ATPase CcmA [Marinobacterium sp.]
MSEPLLEVRQLLCERDDRVLFENLDFSLNVGEVLQIEGTNGSGKTTLLRILCGLTSHYEGDIFWHGELRTQAREAFNRSLLYFGHQPGVKAVLTPLENLHWYSAMHPSMDASRVLWALEQVGLRGYEDVPCHMLSAGQNRRVSLARLYMNDAILWILDEPFTAIDKQGVAQQEALIAQHAINGGAVILTTHHELTMPGPLRRLNLDQVRETL